MEDPILKGRKILVAEDEPEMLGALTEKLKNVGCEVFGAKDGEEALATALKEKPEVILLDILMPKVTGTEVLDRIRKSGDWGKHVAVIMLTNLSADDKIMGNVAKNEPAYYLVKTDWRLEDVVQKVKSCIKPKK